MKINKSLDIDLNIISPQKHIRIHEGDVDSVDILIGVSVDDESVDLDGVTIKYDATINNYLAEQDADGSVVNDKISIPVTQNMTAMSGLLLIDVRMIQSDQVLFTQTICATVEKAVVNGSTYIDFDKITIIQRMNALEGKMDYIEELVENFDTSKLIVSVKRPPEGAPAEVDVDLLRVGDTWILSGANIVYKLVEAQYNYQPVPSAEPYHKFIWQPLNERYGVGNTEPPTTATYQQIVYTINEVQWSWLPVPEYFKGDHYQMQVGVDDPTYYICKSASMPSTGVCAYTWREEGGACDISTKMDLAPLNPTAEEIAAMSAGQLYGDTVNHKGIIKGGQEFYDTVYIDTNVLYRKIYEVVEELPTENIKNTVIYCVPIEGKENEYNMFLYINGAWVPVGSGGFEIFVIDAVSVPESVNWDGEIPETYAGQTGKVPEINFYNGKLWYLYAVNQQQGYDTSYNWIDILDGADMVDLQAALEDKISRLPSLYAFFNIRYFERRDVFTTGDLQYFQDGLCYLVSIHTPHFSFPNEPRAAWEYQWYRPPRIAEVSTLPISENIVGVDINTPNGKVRGMTGNKFRVYDLVYVDNDGLYLCTAVNVIRSNNKPLSYEYSWLKSQDHDVYTKSDIDAMIGDVESLLSQV